MTTGLSASTKNCIVVKILENSLDTLPRAVILLTNFPLVVQNSANWSYSIFPILEGVKGLGVSVNEVTSTVGNGTLEVDCSESSAGHNKRFIDLLNYHYDTYKQVEVEYYSSPEEARNFLDSSTNVSPNVSKTIFKGRLNGFNLDGKNNKLKINITKDDRPNKIITYQVKSDICTNAPDESLGKVLPLVFGQDVHGDTVVLDEWNSATSSIVFGYGTCLGEGILSGYQSYYPDSVSSYWMQDSSGQFKKINSASTTSTVLYNMALDGNERNYAAITNPERRVNAWFIPVTDSTSYLIHSGFVYYYDHYTTPGGGFDEGGFEFSICENENGKPGKVLERVEYTKNDFTWAGANAKKKIDFTFPKPVPLVNTNGYFLVANETAQSGYELRLVESGTATSTLYFKRLNNPDVFHSKTRQSNYWGLYGAKFNDSHSASISANDFKDESLFLSTRYFYVTGLTQAQEGHKLKIKVKINGIKDSASGNVSGVANAYLGNPLDLLRLFHGQPDTGDFITPPGGDWIVSDYTDFDSTLYDSSFYSGVGAAISISDHRYYRKVIGAFRSLTTRDEAIKQVCEEMGCKYVYDCNSGKFGMYAWGTDIVTDDTLNDFNSTITSYSLDDSGSVVNWVIMNYFENLIYDDVRFRPTTEIKNDPNLDGVASAKWVNSYEYQYETSIQRYGLKQDKKTDWRLIGDSQSADAMTKYRVINGLNPYQFVTIEAPLDRFMNLKPMHQVYLIYPQLPSIYGTSARPLAGITASGGINTWSGAYEVRAPTMKGQIYSIKYDLSNKDCKVSLTARILNNSGDPT